MVAAGIIAAPATAAPTLYGVTFSNTLNTIDTSTGASTFVGNLTTAMDPFDLAAYRGNLYTYDQLAVFTGDHHGLIRQLDPATGATVNTIDIGIQAFGEGAMAINPATGAGYLEGIEGLPYFFAFELSPLTGNAIGISNAVLDGLAFSPSGVLYGITQPVTDVTGHARLVVVDALTGAETVVGTNTGVIDNAVLGGLAFAPDGTLYAVESDNVTVTDLYTIDVTTGTATLIGSNNQRFSGIAFLDTSSVPEPPSFVIGMLGILIGGLAWEHRKRAL